MSHGALKNLNVSGRPARCPIMGFDFRTRYQQIAMANNKSGELLPVRRLAGGASQKTS